MPTGPVLLVAIIVAVGYFVGTSAVHGVQKLGCKLHIHQSDVCKPKQP